MLLMRISIIALPRVIDMKMISAILSNVYTSVQGHIIGILEQAEPMHRIVTKVQVMVKGI